MYIPQKVDAEDLKNSIISHLKDARAGTPPLDKVSAFMCANINAAIVEVEELYRLMSERSSDANQRDE